MSYIKKSGVKMEKEKFGDIGYAGALLFLIGVFILLAAGLGVSFLSGILMGIVVTGVNMILIGIVLMIVEGIKV